MQQDNLLSSETAVTKYNREQCDLMDKCADKLHDRLMKANSGIDSDLFKVIVDKLSPHTFFQVNGDLLIQAFHGTRALGARLAQEKLLIQDAQKAGASLMPLEKIPEKFYEHAYSTYIRFMKECGMKNPVAQKQIDMFLRKTAALVGNPILIEAELDGIKTSMLGHMKNREIQNRLTQIIGEGIEELHDEIPDGMHDPDCPNKHND